MYLTPAGSVPRSIGRVTGGSRCVLDAFSGALCSYSRLREWRQEDEQRWVKRFRWCCCLSAVFRPRARTECCHESRPKGSQQRHTCRLPPSMLPRCCPWPPCSGCGTGSGSWRLWRGQPSLQTSCEKALYQLFCWNPN
jgi:hypothetical protein